MRLKQRITRILIQEIVVDVDDSTREIVMMIHWAGGRHSELRVKKNLTGHHSRRTSLEAIEIIRQMAGRFPDDQIAATLNRLGLKTGCGNNWVELRARTARNYQELPSYDPKLRQNILTLEEASDRLGVSHKIVRRLIDSKMIAASQVVPLAPWEIPAEAIQSEQVLREIAAVRRGTHVKEKFEKAALPMLAGIWEEGDDCPSAQIRLGTSNDSNDVVRRCRMSLDRNCGDVRHLEQTEKVEGILPVLAENRLHHRPKRHDY